MKTVKNVLLKVSGDLLDHPEVRSFAVSKARESFVVMISGGGTQINQALRNRGFTPKYSDHGRITETWEERKIARDVLEENQRITQDSYVGTGVYVSAPLVDIGTILCHINGDMMVKAAYLGFDEIFVFTLKNRMEAKQEIFKDFPKIEIIGV